MIYKLSIPIDDYYGTDVFFQDIYFEGERFPSKQVILEKLQELADRDNEDDMNKYFGDRTWEQCIDIVKDAKIPYVDGILIMSSEQVNHPKWGWQPVTSRIIKPIKV